MNTGGGTPGFGPRRMKRTTRREFRGAACAVVLRLLTLLLATFTLRAADSIASADLEFFEKEIRPLLIQRCYECHADEKQKGGLRLDSRPATLRGGASGPALVPGEPEQSALIK